jgi:hypothetical protein
VSERVTKKKVMHKCDVTNMMDIWTDEYDEVWYKSKCSQMGKLETISFIEFI